MRALALLLLFLVPLCLGSDAVEQRAAANDNDLGHSVLHGTHHHFELHGPAYPRELHPEESAGSGTFSGMARTVLVLCILLGCMFTFMTDSRASTISAPSFPPGVVEHFSDPLREPAAHAAEAAEELAATWVQPVEAEESVQSSTAVVMEEAPRAAQVSGAAILNKVADLAEVQPAAPMAAPVMLSAKDQKRAARLALAHKLIAQRNQHKEDIVKTLDLATFELLATAVNIPSELHTKLPTPSAASSPRHDQQQRASHFVTPTSSPLVIIADKPSPKKKKKAFSLLDLTGKPTEEFLSASHSKFSTPKNFENPVGSRINTAPRRRRRLPLTPQYHQPATNAVLARKPLTPVGYSYNVQSTECAAMHLRHQRPHSLFATK